MPRRARWFPLAALALALALAAPALARAAPDTGRGGRLRTEFARLDTRTLRTLLEERGFRPPRHFKAYVVAVSPDGWGGLRFRPFDWRKTSDDADDWWPASTVKLYAAIAALERTHALGFTPAAEVTFHYDAVRHPLPEPPDAEAPGPPAREARVSVEELVRAAITPSDNRAYDRLVELVGFDHLNRRFLTKRNGLRSTALQRSYAHRVRDAETGFGTLRHSPPITITEGERRKKLPERWGRARPTCPNHGNCTSLRDLAEAMRRVMLHEELPPGERFDLGPAELALLRSALAGDRERGQGVVDGLREGFGVRPVALYHKPGYAYRWFSDVVFVRATDTNERWIVAMAGYSRRDVLDAAARHVGALLASGRLKAAPELPSRKKGRAKKGKAKKGRAK